MVFFVVVKYEEINCLLVQEIVYMVDLGYNVDEIFKVECFMFSMFQFEFGWFGFMSFLCCISKVDDYELEICILVKYFLEVIIMDECFVGSFVSYIVVGVYCIFCMFFEKGDWVCSFCFVFCGILDINCFLDFFLCLLFWLYFELV